MGFFSQPVCHQDLHFDGQSAARKVSSQNIVEISLDCVFVVVVVVVVELVVVGFVTL